MKRRLTVLLVSVAVLLGLVVAPASAADVIHSHYLGCSLTVFWHDYGNTGEFSTLRNTSSRTATFNLIGDGVSRQFSVSAHSDRYIRDLVSSDVISTMWAQGYHSACGPTAWYKIPNL